MDNTAQVNKKFGLTLSRQVSMTLASREGKPRTLLADASGSVPNRFPLLQVGMWRTPYHGDIMIMPEDLDEYVENFKAGVGVSGNSKLKLPINYGHDAGGKAAGWFVPAVEGDTLWATEAEWTPAGKKALTDGEWKCISAEFNPRGRGGWIDPLDCDHIVDNVIDGAALTNIPLYSNLEPVMASAASGNVKPKVFILASKVEENNIMDLTAVRAKDADKLTDEEKTFLAENKTDLNAEEQKKFGLEVTPPVDPDKDKKDPEEEEEVAATEEEQEAKVTASLKKKGFAVVSADRLERLEKTATDYETKEAKAVVLAHIARGAIKADSVDKWTSRLIKASTADRKELEADLASLPDNPVMASTQGAGGSDAGDATDVAEELKNKTLEHQKKVKADRSVDLSYAQAQDELLRENDDLRTRVEAARK